MLKKLTALVTALIFIMSVPLVALGATTGTVTAWPNFRSAPSLDSKIYGNLNKGQRVTVLDKVNRYWVKVRANGRTGYISTRYVRYSRSSSGGTVGTITGWPNFRSAPSLSSKVYGNLDKGQRVTVLSKVNKYWVKIRANGRTGYISTRYIRYSGNPSGGSSSSSSGLSNAQRANQLVATAKRFLGVPYKFGAEYPTDRKFDCSSFTQYVYRLNHMTLPRSSRQQVKYGRYVSKSNLQKGDLLFFTVYGSRNIGHVGMYIGNGKMIHTFGKGGVRIDSIHTSYWTKNYVTARRILK